MDFSPNYTWVNSSRRIALEESYADEAMSKLGSGSLPFNNLLGKDAMRVVLPFESGTKREISQELSKEGPLGDQGYDSIDWKTGEALKTVPPNPKAPPGTPPKVQRTKLGKAIGRLPDSEKYLNWWSANQEAAKTDEYSIVISRHPLDVLRMSDHADISSCHSPNSSHWDDCMGEMVYGGMVAYLVNTKDLEALPPEQVSGQDEVFFDEDRGVEGVEPLSRVRIRRYTHDYKGFDLAIPELRMYGMKNSAFKEQVTEWARKVQDTVTQGKRLRMRDFVRRGGKYADNEDGDLFNSFFEDRLDRGNTEFGVEGEDRDYDEDEEDDEEDEEAMIEQAEEERRNEIARIDNRWQRMLANCDVSYDEGEGVGEDLEFYWSSSTGVDFSVSLVHPEALTALNNFDLLNRGDDALTEALNDDGFDLSEGHIDFHSHGNQFGFGISIDSGAGDPDDYDNFCQTIHDDWDERYDELQRTVVKWLQDMGYAGPTPTQTFRESDLQFRNFGVQFDGDEMTALAEASIGEYHPETWSHNLFTHGVEAVLRNLVSVELEKIIQARKHPTGYLPGFEPESPVAVKENYNLNNFRLDLRVVDGQIELAITFVADYLSISENIQEVVELMKLVDRLFPRVVAEGRRMLTSYYNQIGAQKRQLEEEKREHPPEHRPYQWDPHLKSSRNSSRTMRLSRILSAF